MRRPTTDAITKVMPVAMAAEGEAGDQAVNGQQRQGCGVIALEGNVLGHKEQDQIADHRHPEQGHEHRRGHHGQTTQHPDGGESHPTAHIGQGFVHHVGPHERARLRVADGFLEITAGWHVDQYTERWSHPASDDQGLGCGSPYRR